jgi:catechol 2,3-dioxygenase-like lactoylglutathione lyase family enzyme
MAQSSTWSVTRAGGHSTPDTSVIDHLSFGVTNLAESKAFLLKALQPLGVAIAMEGPNGVGIGQGNKPSLWLYETREHPARLHIAFAADNRRQVDEFYRAGIAAGGKDNGPPGLRPHYHPNYYAAFVIGPDGHNIEAVCHEPAA